MYISRGDTWELHFIGTDTLEGIPLTGRIRYEHQLTHIALRTEGGAVDILAANDERAGVLDATRSTKLDRLGQRHVSLTGDLAISDLANLVNRVFVSDDSAEHTITVTVASAQELIDFGEGEFTIKAGRDNDVDIEFVTTSGDNVVIESTTSGSLRTSRTVFAKEVYQYVFTKTRVIVPLHSNAYLEVEQREDDVRILSTTNVETIEAATATLSGVLSASRERDIAGLLALNENFGHRILFEAVKPNAPTDRFVQAVWEGSNVLIPLAQKLRVVFEEEEELFAFFEDELYEIATGTGAQTRLLQFPIELQYIAKDKGKFYGLTDEDNTMVFYEWHTDGTVRKIGRVGDFTGVQLVGLVSNGAGIFTLNVRDNRIDGIVESRGRPELIQGWSLAGTIATGATGFCEVPPAAAGNPWDFYLVKGGHLIHQDNTDQYNTVYTDLGDFGIDSDAAIGIDANGVAWVVQDDDLFRVDFTNVALINITNDSSLINFADFMFHGDAAEDEIIPSANLRNLTAAAAGDNLTGTGTTISVGPYRLGQTADHELLFGTTDAVGHPVERVTVYEINDLAERVTAEQLQEELNNIGGVTAAISPISTRRLTHTYAKYDSGTYSSGSRTVTAHTLPIGTTMQLTFNRNTLANAADVRHAVPSTLAFGAEVSGNYLNLMHWESVEDGDPRLPIMQLASVMDGVWKNIGNTVSVRQWDNEHWESTANAELAGGEVSTFIRVR